jgi:hypothetical protein
MNIEDIDIPPITVQIKFDDMSPQVENLLGFIEVLLITILVYIYLIIFDFIIKRIVFFRQKRQYYVEVDDN